MRIDVLVFDGFAEVDVLATYAVFANAKARVLAVAGGWILEEIERGVIPRQLAEAKATGVTSWCLPGSIRGRCCLVLLG
ncbi:hypothetical protein [Kribbella sp. NPDC051718]|uniref:hypothetical protein n=1 Tax=Kribbella sp. NPDC051718 TaxID=3155168 RepID=UPI003424EFD8